VQTAGEETIMSSSKPRTIALILGIAVVLAIAIQFAPTPVSRINPPVQAEPQWDSPATREMFYRACGDCHSNQTSWPWYSRVAPVSWLIASDVAEGRQRLNVSEWNRPQRGADEAAEVVAEGEMPLPIYLIMHPDARLSTAERQALALGLQASFAK
jgi:mono/diheme cytochrome c family protein